MLVHVIGFTPKGPVYAGGFDPRSLRQLKRYHALIAAFKVPRTQADRSLPSDLAARS